MTFSIHAGSERTYRNIMRQDLSVVASRIKSLVSSAKCSNLRRSFKTSFLVLRENIDEIPEFLQLTATVGIENVRFMKLNSKPAIANASDNAAKEGFLFRYGEQFNQTVFDRFHEQLPEYRTLARELGVKINRGSFPDNAMLDGSSVLTTCAAP